MSFTRARLPGFWTFNSAPAPAEFEHIDDYAYAIDGLNGGTYAPSSVITLGGSGVNITGPLDAGDVSSFNVTGTLTIAVGAVQTMNGILNVNGTSTVSAGGFLTVQSGGTVNFNAGSAFVCSSTITLASTHSIALSPARTYTRTIDHAPVRDATYWGPFLDAESILPIYSSLTTAAGTTEIVWAFRPPSGATVTAVSIFLRPAGAHAGVPSVSISAAKLLRTGNSAVNIATQIDPSASVAAYETPHELALTGLSITFTEGDLLLIRVTPETGANALTSLKVSAPIVTFTRAILGEE